MLYSIGEFSRASGLTIKTLRFYHEQGVLVPVHIDPGSGYRFYDASQVDNAVVIVKLKDLGFSVKEIAEIVRQCDDEGDILELLENQLDKITKELSHLREVRKALETIIRSEREVRKIMSESTFEIKEKTLEPILIAGIRMQGKYQDCGKGFAKIGRRFGRHINGKPMILCYDREYKENDADFETCMPVRNGQSREEIDVRTLPGGRCVSLLHQGPYQTLHRSYERLLKYFKDNDMQILSPCREVYVKGPGMIFKGNPKKYLTEIQMLIDT